MKNKKANSFFIFILKLIILLLLIIDIINFIILGKYHGLNTYFHSKDNSSNNNSITNLAYGENDLNNIENDFLHDFKSNKKKTNIGCFEALYKTRKKNEKIILINKLYIRCLKTVIIKNEKISYLSTFNLEIYSIFLFLNYFIIFFRDIFLIRTINYTFNITRTLK